ncbi:hypothetical protein AVEN_178841-1 [Araneus ventricosus]|uniref:Uncharacterized protein n=1 Tax=Araneus ventricosus TaxID=182803 RepID=A0A4Y2BDW7_ARAVE|nr:hypothetical protein AVEN_178841-1 [Araneus ventricosus]
MPGQTKSYEKSRKKETQKASTRYRILPITRSKTAILENYEVWRNELEKTKDINEICTHLNVSLETLFLITRSQPSSDPNKNPPSFSTSASVANLLKDCVQESTPPERSDTIQQPPKEESMEKKDTFNARRETNDLNTYKKSEGVTLKQDWSEPEGMLSSPDKNRIKPQHSFSEPVFPLNGQFSTTFVPSLRNEELSATFVPSLRNEHGDSMARAAFNPVLKSEPSFSKPVFPFNVQGSSTFVPSLRNEHGDSMPRAASNPVLKSEPSFSKPVFPFNVQGSSTFVPSLRNEHGDSMSRAASNPVLTVERRAVVSSLVEKSTFDLTYYSFSILFYALLSKIFCNLKDFLAYVYDII